MDLLKPWLKKYSSMFLFYLQLNKPVAFRTHILLFFLFNVNSGRIFTEQLSCVYIPTIFLLQVDYSEVSLIMRRLLVPSPQFPRRASRQD